MSKKIVIYTAIFLLFSGCELFRGKTAISEDTTTKDSKICNEANLSDSITVNSTDINGYQVYNWLVSMQMENGLLESSEDSNFVSLYDNALAAIIFTATGDYNKAEKIFSFFNGRLEAEFSTGKGGFGQFRDRNGIPLNNAPHRWLGDNAWLLISLNIYHDKTNTTKYELLSAKLEQWIRSLQDSDGGLFGGYDSSGKVIEKNPEGIIDAFHAVNGYDNFHRNILNFLKNNHWNNYEKSIITADTGKYKYALDLISWPFGMLKDFPVESLTNADRFIVNTISKAKGYSFDEDKDTIWLEGTGQMAVAYNYACDEEKVNSIISEMEKMFITSTKFTEAKGLPYASNMGTGFGSGMLWDGVDSNLAVSANVWYLLAKTKFNVYKVGRDKDIPSIDLFYY